MTEQSNLMGGVRYVGLLNALEARDEKYIEDEIEKLGQQGESISYLDIGEAYEEGFSNVGPDLVEAIKWYEKGALKAGDGMSFFSLGRIYYSGAIGKGGLDLACQAFEQGAARGVPEAAIFLAYGIISGVFPPRDNEYLVSLLESPRRQGFVAADLMAAKMHRRTGGLIRARLMVWWGVVRAVFIKLRNGQDRRLYLIDSV